MSVTPIGGVEKEDVLPTGLPLATRDGRKIGNAVIVWSEPDTELGRLYGVRTDFGNRAVLTRSELVELFHFGDQPDDVAARTQRQHELLARDAEDWGEDLSSSKARHAWVHA